MKRLFFYLPWTIALLLLVALIYFFRSSATGQDESRDEITSTMVLERVERLGKLELVKHHFSEVIEVERSSSQSFIFRQLVGQTDPDLKAVLISRGEAVACIDLAQLKESDITVTDNRIELKLPKPTLCYYKLDLENTKLYSLESGFFVSKAEERKFIDLAYREAEGRMEEAALAADILKEAEEQAEIILSSLLRSTSQKQIIINRTVDLQSK